MKISSAADEATYDVVFGAEIVYQPDCWRLCGDAHCCHFDRYRRHAPAHERGVTRIPMMAGEYAYMAARGHLSQYARHQLETTTLPGDAAEFRFEMLSVPVDARCPCDHPRRPTICRLYPLMPLFEPGRGLVGIDTCFTVFEVVEELGGTERACKLTQAPFAQFDLFVRACAAIARNPRCLFSLMAHEASKRLFRDRLVDTMRSRGLPVYHALALLMQSGDYVDRVALAGELDGLVARFRQVYGASFDPNAPA